MKTSRKPAASDPGQELSEAESTALERAMTIDEYIERRRESFTPNKMNQVRSLLPALSFKALQADIEGRYNLVIHIDTL